MFSIFFHELPIFFIIDNKDVGGNIENAELQGRIITYRINNN